MTLSTGGTFQTQKPFHSLNDQVLQISGLDSVLQEIATTNLLEQTRTEVSINREKNIVSADSIQKCSAPETSDSNGDCQLGEECISSYGIRKGVEHLPATHGVRLSPSIATVNYRDASVEAVAVECCLQSMDPLASFVGHDSNFDQCVMDSKDDVDSGGPLQSASLVCSNSMVAVHKKSRGTVLHDSRNLVEMYNERSGNKEGTDISERNCIQALAFEHFTIEGKDGFQSAVLTDSTDVTGQESPISVQKLLRVASGRNLVSTTSPSGSGKAIGVTDLFGRQPLPTDQDSVYAKDASHSPGPSMSTNESPASVEKTVRGKDISETCNGLVGTNSLPTGNGKVADVRELNSRQKKSSCSVETEDITSKSWPVNMAKGARIAGLGTSSACISVNNETARQSLVCENGNEHEMYLFRRPALNSQGVAECAAGKGFFPSPLEKPEKQARQELIGGQREHVFHKVHNGSGPGDQGFILRNNKERLLQQELQKSGLPADVGIHLIDILEGLVSLDENGFFSNPMEDSFGPDDLKTMRKPICFSFMRDKIHSKDYKTWRSFVVDFEDICHFVMNYKEKGSSIWNAAHTLLYRGKKYLEQYADKAEMFFGVPNETKEGKSACHLKAFSNGHSKVGNMVNQDAECSFAKSNKEISKSVLPVKYNNLPDQKLVSLLRTRDTSVLPGDENLQNACGSTLLCTQNRVYVEELEENRSNTETVLDNMCEANLQEDDSMVEILKCTGDEIRFNPVEQATECSSSFGDTEYDSDNDDGSGSRMYSAAEVQSDLRNGNGAATSVEVDAGGLKKRKKALTLEWKEYRHPIEWRCQWLDLHIRELMYQASKYDHALADIEAGKPWKDGHQVGKAFTARSSPLIDSTYRHRVLQRKQRKKVENTVELSSDISRHPVFSSYEKMKRLEADGGSIDDDSNSMKTVTVDVSNNRSDENDFNNHLTVTESKDGEKSVEQMLWQIETLQSRILKMKNQLSRYNSRKAVKYSARNISNSFLKAKASKGVFQRPAFSPMDSVKVGTPVGGGLKSQMEPDLSCQHNSKFDSSNLVMSCNGTSSYVEPAQHDFIESPKWRQLYDTDMILDQPEREDSSDEVTNEETCKEHNAVIEVKEKQQQDFPSPVKKLTEAENIVGKGAASQSQTTGAAEKDVSQAAVGEGISNIISLPFGLFIPRCKRRKLQSRSSSLQKVEALHASPVEEQNNPLMQDYDVNELKMESKTRPFCDGIRDSV